MFKIITNGVEPTLEDIREGVTSIMVLFHENLLLDVDVVFVGSNKGRIVEISKFSSVNGTVLSTTYKSENAQTKILCNEYYTNGDNLYRATIENEVPWVMQATRRLYDDEDTKVTVYVQPKQFDLIEFATYFLNIMHEVNKL